MERLKMGRLATLGCGLTMLALAGPAKGELMAYEFTGIVDWAYDNLLDGSVYAGTEFSGLVTFDSNSADQNPSSSLGSYSDSSFSMTLNVGSYSWFSGGGNAYVRVEDGSYGDTLALSVVQPFPIGDGVRIHWITIYLADETGDVFSSDALPVTTFPLSAFTAAALDVKGDNLGSGSGTFKFSGTLTEFAVTPEPASILYLALALSLLRRR